MGSAADYLKAEDEIIPAIKIDNEIKDRIAGYFSEIEDGLKQGSLPADDLVKKIVAAELSEWNDIFFISWLYLQNQPKFLLVINLHSALYYINSATGLKIIKFL